MKKSIIYIFVLFISLFAHAEQNLPLQVDQDDPRNSTGRSIDMEPSATLDGTELTLSYPLSTESQVIIIDQSTQSTVCSETFAATRSLNIDLEEEGLDEGSYTLRIYAFGKWWVGEFVIE